MLLLAFDNGYHENPAVVRQLARLLKLRLDDNQGNGFYAETKILAWSRKEKGIDGALLRAGKLEELTIADWFSALGEESCEEVRNVWESQD